MSQTTPYSQPENQVDAFAAGAKVSHGELELSCINLIAQLEIQVESARTRTGHVENASENTDRVLTQLLDFADAHLVGKRFEQSISAIEKASFASLAHKEVLSARSLGSKIRNLFGSNACADESVRQTYDKLGDSVLEACVEVLRQAVATLGAESSAGATIEQSTAVFMEEFKANW